MATLAQIQSPVWTLSLSGNGAIEEGLNAIKQCIDVVLRTTKGTDPLRPLFGSDIYLYIDLPVNISVPLIKKAILDAVSLWETRVTITNIAHQIINSQVIFNITYTLNNGVLSDSISVTLSNNGVYTNVSGQRLSLQGFFPPNSSGLQYNVSLVLNGSVILPQPPVNGFSTIAELYAWVQSNWGNYGQWYLTGQGLIGYIIAGYTTGSLTISVLSVRTFSGVIPALPGGYKYGVNITVNGVNYSMAPILITPSKLLNWVILTIGGQWALGSMAADFSDDFSDDFSTSYQVLTLTSDTVTSATITITAIPV